MLCFDVPRLYASSAFGQGYMSTRMLTEARLGHREQRASQDLP